eukprot:g10013.t1
MTQRRKVKLVNGSELRLNPRPDRAVDLRWLVGGLMGLCCSQGRGPEDGETVDLSLLALGRSHFLQAQSSKVSA